MNNICLIGRICADPELRQTENGNAVTQLRIAVRRPRAKEDITDFFNIVCWRQSAEYVCKYGKKGDQIGVNGILCNREYTNQEGQKRYITEVVADNVQLVGGRREQGTPSGEPSGSPESASQGDPRSMENTPGTNFEELKGDDDLPF